MDYSGNTEPDNQIVHLFVGKRNSAIIKNNKIVTTTYNANVNTNIEKSPK